MNESIGFHKRSSFLTTEVLPNEVSGAVNQRQYPLFRLIQIRPSFDLASLLLLCSARQADIEYQVGWNFHMV